MARAEGMAGEVNLELADMRRNPYLVDYSKARVGRSAEQIAERRRGMGQAAGNGRDVEQSPVRRRREPQAGEDLRRSGQSPVRRRREPQAGEDLRRSGQSPVRRRRELQAGEDLRRSGQSPVRRRRELQAAGNSPSGERMPARKRSARQAYDRPHYGERYGVRALAYGEAGRVGYRVVNGGREGYGGITGVRRQSARQRARLRKALIQRCFVFFGALACILLLAAILHLQKEDQVTEPAGGAPVVSQPKTPEPVEGDKIQGIDADIFNAHPQWTENFLTPNEFSRPGDPLDEVKNIFVHYTANPGTSAAQNRSYFESLKDTQERSASAHFIIGYEGEIIQCIPMDEIAYAVQTRNEDSISIECCYVASNGSFTQSTYDSLVKLLGWLTEAYDLDTEDILRHYDCGGKKCPLYYTDNPDAWERLKQDVKNL